MHVAWDPATWTVVLDGIGAESAQAVAASLLWRALKEPDLSCATLGAIPVSSGVLDGLTALVWLLVSRAAVSDETTPDAVLRGLVNYLANLERSP